MITDFIEDDRADPRPGVGPAECVRLLRRILCFTRADDVTTKADSVLRCAESEAVAITGQVAGGIRGVEVNLLPVRIEPEAVRRGRVGIPVILAQDQVTTRRNDVGRGDAEFPGNGPLVGEVPVADIDVGRVGVVEFDRIELGRVSMRERFVDQNAADGRWRVVRAR